MAIKILVLGTSGVLNDGITSWMRQTFGAMNLEGLEIVTVAFEDCDPSVVDAVEKVGIRVVTVPSRKKNPRAYVRAYRALLEKENFSIVHVCCNSALASFELREARKYSVKMRIAHSHNTTCGHRVADRLLRPVLYREATDYYACGKDAGKWLFGNRQFKVIPNGKDLGLFTFSSSVRVGARAELGLNDDAIALGHVGRFNAQKNHGKLLEIFKELRGRSPRYELVLIGDGALFNQTKENAESLGIQNHVHFLGRRDDVPQLLNAMDCMVFPSLYEGFPNVVLEWQLNGLPVVMSETITDECAITPLVSQVALNDSAAVWADAIEDALKGRDRALDSASGVNSAKTAGYDIRDNAAMLRRLYMEGINRCK